MANSKGASNVRSMLYGGKNSLLPPKSPFPSVSPSYADYIPNSAVAPKPHQSTPRDGNSHQRTSSESFLMVEQPSWLDELLDEPETPVRRGHRRSSSDSFAYIDSANGGMTMSANNYMTQDDNKYRNLTPVSPWHSSDFDINRGAWNPLGSKSKNKPWDAVPIAPSRGLLSPRGNNFVQSAKLSNMVQDTDGNLTEKKDLVESGLQTEKKDSSNAKSLEADSKRAKQQFAQRSRVRKLQYIAELERNVQALQVEGCEVSAELEFLNQQSLILSMENKALKQRLESLAQEQLIKYLEHEVLEREVGRLRSLYQQQKQPQPQPQPTASSHRRTKSRDLDQQFANLSLKQSNEARDSVSGQLPM